MKRLIQHQDLTDFLNFYYTQFVFFRVIFFVFHVVVSGRTYNYEFDLLKTWDFIGLDYGFILYSPNYDCGKQVKPGSSICDGTIIEMISSNTTAETDIDKWYESGENHLLRNSDNPPPKTKKPLDINRIKALKTENTINTDTYYFIYKNNVYILRVSSASKLDKELAKPHVEKLLSSFMFFDN